VNVLVVNCGSSSVKLDVVAVDGASETRRARVRVERVGEGARLVLEADGRPSRDTDAVAEDHRAAVHVALDALGSADPGLSLDAVGHRIVHGGERFVGPTRVDDEVVRALEALETLAPLHNGPGLAGIRACRERLGGTVPMVAVFDTAFHATLPEAAARYALPDDLARRHRIRRYGFHGTSCRSVLDRLAALTGRPPERTSAIVLHLGNGCSATAVRDGRSVDTSMGFTPLEGLVMGTRAGDLDPAVVAHLTRAEGVDATTVEAWLNERAGLLGVSGRSADMRELLAHAGADPRARLAVEMFCYRARKYVGAYLAALEGQADALVFTGGIGEHAAAVRAGVCEGLAWAGVALDPAANARADGGERDVSAAGARVRSWVIPTDEARTIARDTAACLRASAPAGGPR
jgi:acetate kinase